jgi:hypothetical protein
VKITPCFCKICGNYICSTTIIRHNISAQTKNWIACKHYKLFDSLSEVIGNISGHIHCSDENEILSTIDSMIKCQSELNMRDSEYYKAKIMDLIYDQ